MVKNCTKGSVFILGCKVFLRDFRKEDLVGMLVPRCLCQPALLFAGLPSLPNKLDPCQTAIYKGTESLRLISFPLAKRNPNHFQKLKEQLSALFRLQGSKLQECHLQIPCLLQYSQM